MKVYINDLEVDKSIINVNSGLNFGRFDYEGLVIAHYKILLSSKEFTEAIEADYNSIRDEVKQDDRVQNETSDFTAINYGSITTLLQNKEALQEITITYLDKILFSKLFAESINSKFIINSTDSIEFKNGSIVILGRSYQKRQVLN